MKKRGDRSHTRGSRGASPGVTVLQVLIALVLVVSCIGANAPPFPWVHPLAVGHPPGSGLGPAGEGGAHHRLNDLRPLPALSQGAPSSRLEPLPDDRPALHCYIPQPKPWLACRACTLSASLGTTPTALVRPLVSPLICRCHQRWLGTADEPVDIGISAVPEILTACRRIQRLRLGSGSPQVTADCIQAAWNIT